MDTKLKISRLKQEIINVENTIDRLKADRNKGYDVSAELREAENLVLDLKDTLDILEFEEYNSNRDYFGG